MYDAHTGEEFDAADRFDDMLDEVYGDEIEIAGITFPASKILEECDPIAYRTYLSDYESEQLANGEWCEHDPDDEDDEED